MKKGLQISITKEVWIKTEKENNNGMVVFLEKRNVNIKLKELMWNILLRLGVTVLMK